MAYTFLDSLDIVSDFLPRYESVVRGLYVNQLVFDVTSTRETEEYAFVGMPGQLREWVNGRSEDNLKRYTYTVRNRKYENTLAIPLEDLRRDKTEMLRLRVLEMAQKAAEHDVVLLADVLNTNPNGYDGVPLFSTAHPESGVNQNNAVTSAQVAALDVATPAAPTPDEFSRIIVGLIGHLYSFTDDKGDPINQGARAFHILVPTAQYWAAANSAISLTNLTSGASNPVLGLQNSGVTLSLTYEPRLTTLASNNQFVVSIIDHDTKPFIRQIENAIDPKVLGPGTDEEFKNDRHLFGVTRSAAIAPGFWSKTIRGTLS